MQQLIEILNYRIQQEEYSSRLYEQMSLWFNNKGLMNLSKLYKKYSLEELEHAQWSKDYLLDYGITPTLKMLNPPTSFNSVKEILDATLSHEQDITKQCETMAEQALLLKDFVLFSLATKYCKEQQEEIGKAITLLDVFALNDNLLIFDQYVATL